jgi:hypothetical protein
MPQFGYSEEVPKEFFMSRQIVFTSKAAKPSPTYSQAVKASAAVGATSMTFGGRHDVGPTGAAIENDVFLSTL